MQVANKPLIEIELVDKYLKRAHSLVFLIDMSNNAACSHSFASSMSLYKENFPHTFAAFNAFGVQLHLLDAESRLEIKRTLLCDLRACVSKAEADIECPKLLLSESLPADPGASLVRLEELMAKGKAQIEAINYTFNCIAHARTLMHRMQDNKQKLASFDETVFTSAPETIFTSAPRVEIGGKERRAVKKARTG
jgi:hypothetical protein